MLSLLEVPLPEAPIGLGGRWQVERLAVRGSIYGGGVRPVCGYVGRGGVITSAATVDVGVGAWVPLPGQSRNLALRAVVYALVSPRLAMLESRPDKSER